jgi:hypothetical protein
VPLEFGHFRDQKPTARPKELGLLGVERGSPGPKGPAPKGLKNLAHGLPCVFGLSLEALKGCPLTRRQGTSLEVPVAPSGLLTLGRVSQGKPWAMLSWPFGPKTRLQLHPCFRQMSKLQRHFVPGYDQCCPLRDALANISQQHLTWYDYSDRR